MVAEGAQDKRATDFLEESMSFTQSTFKMHASEQVNLSYRRKRNYQMSPFRTIKEILKGECDISREIGLRHQDISFFVLLLFVAVWFWFSRQSFPV